MIHSLIIRNYSLVILDGYKIFLSIVIAGIVMLGVVIGVPFAKSYVGLPEYDLYVDARIDRENLTTIGQVLIQNIVNSFRRWKIRGANNSYKII